MTRGKVCHQPVRAGADIRSAAVPRSAALVHDAGVDVVTVSKALGHANVDITLLTYAHAIPKQRHGLATLWRGSWRTVETKWKHPWPKRGRLPDRIHVTD